MDELIARLLSRGHRGMVLGMDRIHAALRALGNPEEGLLALHVAGSNGKGSVCAMLDAALAEAGVRRGLYTSPHLERFNERIAIEGAPIDDGAFTEALERTFADAPDDLTFFETLTAAAFLAFRAANVEVAVLEVGLGGRLDATNVVEHPLAASIVSISIGANGKHLEHADLLGTTVEALAREKAGIFKRGAPAVLGPLDGVARRAALEIAENIGAKPIIDARALVEETGMKLAPALLGAHQIDNAAVAAAMLEIARERVPRVTRKHVEDGIRSARWPGRLERIDLGVDRPSVLLDAAHNIDGARVLVRALASMSLDPARTWLVFGALADKAFAPFLELVAPLADHRVYTCPGGRAPAPLAELARIAEGTTMEDPKEAIDLALRAAAPGDTVLVTGSIYLVGTIRAHLTGTRRDPALGL